MLVPLRCHGSFSCIGNTGVWSAFNFFSWCIEGVVVSRCTRVTTSVISQDYKLSRCLLGDIPSWSSSETSSKRLHLLERATAVTSKTCQRVGFFLGPRALQLFPSSPITSPAHHSPFYQSREDTPTAPLSISFTFPNLNVSFRVLQPRIQPLLPPYLPTSTRLASLFTSTCKHDCSAFQPHYFSDQLLAQFQLS
jgi:hypothetical protein